MCLIIVDASVMARVFLSHDDPEFSSLNRALFGVRRPNPVLVYGGKLTQEYRTSTAVTRAVVQLDRAGRARAVPDIEIQAAADEITGSGTPVSDDEHVLGLARVSGARVLCSDDKPLRTDFKNAMIVNNPRGKLYSRSSHKKLLSHNC